MSALQALFDLAAHDATSSHVVLIPAVAATLVFLRRDSIFEVVRPAGTAGVSVALIGAGVLAVARVWGDGGIQGLPLTLAVSGLVVMWVGGFLLFYGWRAARAAAFPLSFLVFTIPIPSALLNAATLFLKEGSREAVAGLFTLTRTPYYQEGFTFALPKFVIEIADECSGIRSSIALFLTSLLVGHLFFKGPWTRAFIMIAVIPVAVLKNGIRIVSLSLLASYVDPGFLTGRLHHDGGIVFYVVTLAIFAPLVVLLNNWETSSPRQTR